LLPDLPGGFSTVAVVHGDRCVGVLNPSLEDVDTGLPIGFEGIASTISIEALKLLDSVFFYQ